MPSGSFTPPRGGRDARRAYKSWKGGHEGGCTALTGVPGTVGPRVVSGGADRRLRLWGAGGAQLAVLELGAPARSLMSPGPRVLCCGTAAGAVELVALPAEDPGDPVAAEARAASCFLRP
jgi:hypothetical protein